MQSQKNEQLEPENLEQPNNNVEEIFTEDLLKQITEDCEEIIGNFSELGRLKKTLKTKCPLCGSPLQVRIYQVKSIIDGDECSEDEDRVVCKTCDYEEEVEEKKKRKQKYKENSLVQLEETEAKEKRNARNSKPSRTSKGDGRYSRKGDFKRKF